MNFFLILLFSVEETIVKNQHLFFLLILFKCHILIWHTIRAGLALHSLVGVEVCDIIYADCPRHPFLRGPIHSRCYIFLIHIKWYLQSYWLRNPCRKLVKVSDFKILIPGNGCVPPSVLLVLVNEHLLKENVALEVVLEIFTTVKNERGVGTLVTALKKGQLEGRWDIIIIFCWCIMACFCFKFCKVLILV